MGRTLGIIILVIVVLVILYFAYKYFSKPSSIKTNTEDTTSTTAPAIVYDYFVNGNSDHDKNVFAKGLECAKAFLYGNSSNDMANAVLAASGRGGVGGACAGFNCNIASKITGLSQADKGTLLNYINNLQVNVNWQSFSNMAVGNKNMCSIILEEAVKQKLPALWATSGRG